MYKTVQFLHTPPLSIHNESFEDTLSQCFIFKNHILVIRNLEYR